VLAGLTVVKYKYGLSILDRSKLTLEESRAAKAVFFLAIFAFVGQPGAFSQLLASIA
jgi:hypothetical protein